MIFETHAHYDDEQFDVDRNSLLTSMPDNGIGHIVNSGASRRGCEDSIQLSEQYQIVYASLGFHPEEADTITEDDLEWLKNQCINRSIKKGGKVVALGEIGLDYHYEEPGRDVQKNLFIRQMQMSKEVGLPVVVHSRDAAKDTIELLNEYYADGIPGIIHCYSYSREMAKDYLAKDFCFGIGGVVTFKNAQKLKDVVEYLPLENILLETDSPYLAPEPNRGSRNSSLNLYYVAGQIALLKNISEEEVIAVTEANAKRVYGFNK